MARANYPDNPGRQAVRPGLFHLPIPESLKPTAGSDAGFSFASYRTRRERANGAGT